MGIFGKGRKNTNVAEAQEPKKQQRVQLFEVFESAHKWTPQFSQIFFCNNDEDNLPVETILTKSDTEEYTFMVSQNRSAYKKLGQDCIAMAKHNVSFLSPVPRNLMACFVRLIFLVVLYD